MPSVRVPMKAKQNLEAEDDDLELVELLHEIKDAQGAAIGGIEFMLRAHDVAHGLLDPLIVVGLVIEPDGIKVVGILQVAHGGKGDVDDTIGIFVAGLHLGSENTHDFEADAIDADVLAEGVASGEELVFGFRTDDCDTRALDLIFGIVEASLGEAKAADVENAGIFAVDANGVGASVVLHGRVLLATGRDVGDLGDVGAEQINVVERDAEGQTGLLATGLHGRAAGDHDHEFGAKIPEDIGDGDAETIAVGEQHDDGGDAPGHAQHGERGTAPVVAHRVVGFVEQVADH